jgi:hypothetical protein
VTVIGVARGTVTVTTGPAASNPFQKPIENDALSAK